MARSCIVCGARAYSDYCFRHKPRAPLKRTPLARPTRRIQQQSEKEKIYQNYKETVIRPAVIARDGNYCYCCGRPAHEGEKLDLEHTKGKGPRPDLKRDISNIRLYCRFPCHRNKTDGIACTH